MKFSPSIILVVLCAVFSQFSKLSFAQAQTQDMSVLPAPETSILASLKATHPRLIATSDAWQNIKKRRGEDATLDAFLKRQEVEARALLAAPPIEYKKEGRRLLKVSRIVVRRVLLLSSQYRLTGDEAFLRRAQEEMLNVAAFSDWNPTHFLDVGEMTTALALGYDWLYDQLDANTRQSIRTAIVEKGLKPGLDPRYNGWKKGTNNWNSVCFAGMSLGALAIAEDEPALAAQMLQLAKELNHNGLTAYAPVGVYPEGAMYWGYGTSFQALLLNSLQSALGTDWGLSQSPGFLQSADAILQNSGPTGAFFNYSDGVERPSLESADFWYAHVLKRPELASVGLKALKSYSTSTKPVSPTTEGNRLMPLVALWWPETSDMTTTRAPLQWYGPGSVPLAAFRTKWDDPGAMYLALKGGKATASHGHMDAGEFVFEADGVRWARDLGMQGYESLESKGVKMWDSKQDGGRWTVFRLNNFSHTTLTINGQLHRAEGQAEITHFATGKEAGAIVDLSPVFEGQASRVTRGFAFRDDHVLVRDELEGLKAGDRVRWAMVTDADVTVSEDGAHATLTQKGKQLNVRLQCTLNARFEVVPAAPPQNNYDQPNPNSRLLIVNFTAPESGKLDWTVWLQPQSRLANATDDVLAQTALKNWNFALTNKG